MQLTDNEYKLLEWLSEKIEKNEISNTCLVEIIKLCGSYLNICTITNYAKQHNLSYPGVLKSPKVNIVELFGVKFAYNND